MNKVLLVIDVQEDYLGENRNKDKFKYQNPQLLIENINKAIEKYTNDGYEVIYIAEVLDNIFTNKLIFGFSLRGTEGAKLVKGMNVINQNYYEKQLPSAFTNKMFSRYIRENNIEEAVLCGIDEAGCLGATAKDCVKYGLKTFIISNATDTILPEKAKKIRERLKNSGTVYI